MSKTLIVIESPKKADAYRKYLGSDYKIVASYGHVIDLPQKGGLAVDLKDNFKPTYVIMDDKKDVVSNIIADAKKSDLVLLMTDPDREGEAISWHLSKQFPKTVKFKRAATASITKTAILDAIKNAREIDMRMVDSYETRRILDRLCGFKTSFLVKQATGGQSAGRVQSAALRILAEREKEIRAFVPVEYWPVDVELLTIDKKTVAASVTRPDRMDIKTEAIAKEVEKEIRDYIVKVASYDTQKKETRAQAPFTTSKLQGTASSMFGWDQKRTMRCAQALYEGGHITYMRTDSTHIVPETVGAIRSTINSQWGSKYLPDRAYVYAAGKNAQEAHEAIRPTHLENEQVTTGDEQKLYTLIWKRTVASQMMPEIREQVRATFSNGRNKVLMAASGSRQLFDGWKACWDYRDASDTFLPLMKVGDKVDVLDVSYEQKFTEPPPRYGVATFNTKLEEMGIARPSTLATVTETLKARKYIETQKNTHHVTDLGLRVVDFLVNADFCFVNTSFTREMEDKLDDILSHKAEKLDVLTDFWGRLQKDIKNAQGTKAEQHDTEFKCPTCAKAGRDKYLQKKFSRFGPFFSCEARTDKEIKCEYTAQVGKEGEPVEKVKKVAVATEHKCPSCNGPLFLRKGKFGDFLGCAKWQDPKCKGFFNLDGTKKAPAQKRKWNKKNE